jgi:signal peptidase II
MRKKTIFVSLIVSVIVILDQMTKWIIAHSLAVHDAVPVFESFFHITHERNTGAAFSLLARAPASFRQPFFLLTTFVAVSMLLMFLRKVEESDWLTMTAIGGILGGAVGNFIDRVLYGEVVDFLLVHWRGYYWPAFNVADSCITVGVICLLLASFKSNHNFPSNSFSHG